MTIRKELGACGTGRQQCAGNGWLRLSCSLAIGTIITDNYALAPTPGEFTSSVWLRPSQLFQLYSRVLGCTHVFSHKKISFFQFHIISRMYEAVACLCPLPNLSTARIAAPSAHCPQMVGTSRCDVPARVSEGGTNVNGRAGNCAAERDADGAARRPYQKSGAVRARAPRILRGNKKFVNAHGTIKMRF
jgi:hypothetical protein